jgi:serine/threonine protein kinase/tetratricopeptide (TPR) repeat protein
LTSWRIPSTIHLGFLGESISFRTCLCLQPGIQEAKMADRTGEHFGNYRLVRLLGQGGYAEVYLGQHLRLNQQAAIKVLHAHLTQTEAEHFQQEAQTISTLVHPSIIRVFDYDIEDGVPFLVMDYAPNGSLRQRYPKGSQIPLSQIISLVRQIADALQYAHEQKFIHRDVKSENMLLGRREEVLLSDFGIATIAHSSGSLSTEEAVGTLAYMAPEQIEGHPREASDQYALGCVVYEWLCGSRPFEGSPTELIVQQLRKPPPPLHEKVSTIPLEVEQVVLRALAKDPKMRFASVRDFATALEQASLHTLSFHMPFAWEQTPLGGSVEPDYATIPTSQSAVPPEAISSPPAKASSLGAVPLSQTSGGQLVSEPTTHQPGERPWNVPFARNPFFTGRGQLLQRLHEQLSHSRRAALNQSAALSGLGGIGKTQTAIEYAYRYADEYTAVFWVRADSHEMLVADFVSIARLLDLPGQDAQDQMLIVAAVKRWLEQYEGWLLTLDNADDLSLVTDFLPTRGKGYILLTTRTQATGNIAKTLPVEKMEPSEGLQLLLCRAKLLDPDEPLDTVSATVHKDAQALVSELDSLPLALDQAGAYIEETGSSISEYLALYQRRRLAMLKRQSTLSSDYPHTVASTWALSFQQVEHENPAAADLLRLCSFLHPDALPEDILTQGAHWLGSLLQEVVTDPLQLNEAIQHLRRYSLLKRDPEAKLLNLHRLVQVVLKESLDQAVRRQWAEYAVRAVAEAFPQVEFANWARCELYLPHVLVCAQLIEEYHFSFSEAARLLQSAGRYLFDRGQYTQSELLYQRALDMCKQLVGLEHADTASILNDLAKLYMLVGKYEQAEPLLKETLTIRERVLGPEHPEIARTLKDLGWLSSSQGKYKQAEPLLQSALSIGEQALGPIHPDLAEILNDLAALYYYQGKYEQAKPLYQRGISIYENTLGPEHPDTLSMLSNLAVLYRSQGEYKQAEPLLQRTLAIRERVLGPEHPELAISLFHLGQLYCFQGKYEQAKPLLQHAHSIDERVLGPEHPYTTHDLLYLAQLSQADGQVEQAESLYQRALRSFESALGSEHPYVVETLTNLAQLYTVQGNYEQAEALLLRAVALEGVLGEEHPQIAKALSTLGNLSHLQGRDEQAEQLLQRALSLREQSLGKNHPDVAQTLHHLAQLYQEQGKDELAQTFYQRALTIREQALGPDHSDSFATREALIILYNAEHSQ